MTLIAVPVVKALAVVTVNVVVDSAEIYVTVALLTRWASQIGVFAHA
jgi:hypothetical protein